MCGHKGQKYRVNLQVIGIAGHAAGVHAVDLLHPGSDEGNSLQAGQVALSYHPPDIQLGKIAGDAVSDEAVPEHLVQATRWFHQSPSSRMTGHLESNLVVMNDSHATSPGEFTEIFLRQ